MSQPPIANYFEDTNETLGRLLIKFRQLKKWNQWLKECLPEETTLLNHCQIVGLDKKSLIVITDNAHWVTRFRFFIPKLIIQLQQYDDLKNIQAICCKVRPTYDAKTQQTQRGPLVISAETAKLVKETAGKIKDEKLKGVLKKMAAPCHPRKS